MPKTQETPTKNPAAVALGKLGGAKGGSARAANLTREELSEIGRRGGLASAKAKKKAKRLQKVS